jgi:iron complex transport system permease protein
MKAARTTWMFCASGGLVAGAVLVGLMAGAWPIDVRGLLTALWSPVADPLAGSIVWEIRLPRVALALLVGAMLSVSGAIFQVLLRNPLADPYVLGVSGGAAVGGIAALLVAGSWGGWSLSMGALLGALFTVTIVFLLAGGWRGASGDRLLLTGVVMASLWGACVTLFLSMSQDDRLRSLHFWLLGDLGQAPWLWGAGGACALGVLAAWMLGRSMNALAFGDRHAWSLGVSVRPARLALYGVGSLLTAVAVASAGAIGFVGLIVPHTVRLMGCHDYRVLVPLSALLGGTFLTVADTAARTVSAPVELPVGVVTAFVGVPFFLWLLRKERAR